MVLSTRLAALMLALTLLSSCGEGYVLEPARLNLINATADSTAELQAAASDFLAQEGFEDLGRDDEMIALMQRSPSSATDPMIDRLSRTRAYWNKGRQLTVAISDYSDGSAVRPEADYVAETMNFVEISVIEARPGGASREAHEFYRVFTAALRTKLGDDIVEVNGLPATDEVEYRRVKRVNQFSIVAVSCIAFLVTFIFISPLALFLLRMVKITTFPKRVIFTVMIAWLSTPVLTPAALTVLPAPNLFAFPWTHSELYNLGENYNQISLVCSIIFCASASMLLIKNRRDPSPLNQHKVD